MIKENCNFFKKTARGDATCIALRQEKKEKFYKNNNCDNCPFFKTKEDFLTGWRNRKEAR